MRLLQLSGFCDSFVHEARSIQSSKSQFGLKRDYCGSAIAKLRQLYLVLGRAAVCFASETDTNGDILCDLRSVLREPRRLTHGYPKPVSSEAAVLIAREYLRGLPSEIPGTHWYDVLELNPSRSKEGFIDPHPQQIKNAANSALKKHTKHSIRRERVLGEELQKWFRSKPRRKNPRFSPTGSPFLDLVIPPYNTLIVAYGGRPLNGDHLLEDLCRRYSGPVFQRKVI